MARFTGGNGGGLGEDGIPQFDKFQPDYNSHYVDTNWNGKHVYLESSGGNWDAVFVPTDDADDLPIGFAFTIVTDQDSYCYLSPVDSEVTYMYGVSCGYGSNGYDITDGTMVTVLKVDVDKWFVSGYGVTQD